MAQYPAPSLRLLLLLLSICFPAIYVVAGKHSQPNALVLPVFKHASTLQYTTSIVLGRRTSSVPTNVALDLNGKFLWVSRDSNVHDHDHDRDDAAGKGGDCEKDIIAAACCGKPHQLIQYYYCCCFSNIVIRNAFSGMIAMGNSSEDSISLQSTDGLSPGAVVSADPFLLFSAPENLSHGLAGGTKGVVGLGRTTPALPTQLSTLFNISRKFGICLPPGTGTKGVIFIGDGPYALLPGIDVSKILTYTPLIQRYPITSPSWEKYFIGVRSIMVNGRCVAPLIRGSSSFSTTSPYSLLETSIYKSLTRVFIEEAVATNLTRVAPIAPFGVCFSTKASGDLPFRPSAPVIDLVLQSREVFWRIFEMNSMIPVGEDALCLGFLDGGRKNRVGAASMVIGAHLLEDNFLQFDLESSRLGFTSSLLLSQTSCANFNFTSHVTNNKFYSRKD
ncbi:hypothetical protein Dimus_021724 [Dionaea muscipula]